VLVAGSATQRARRARAVRTVGARRFSSAATLGTRRRLSQYGTFGYAQKGFLYDNIVLHYFPDGARAATSRATLLLTTGVATLGIGSTADFKVRDATGWSCTRSQPGSTR